jgi:hypothetical protein
VRDRLSGHHLVSRVCQERRPSCLRPRPSGSLSARRGCCSKASSGDRASELSIERPSRFELVVNAKTGRTLGLVFPTSLLAFADEVIE